jgi:hypothetical protein
MAIRITDDTMSLEIGDRVVATARFSEHATADRDDVGVFLQVHLKDSYGRRNRQAIAVRETHVAACLRTVERVYRTAIEHDAAIKPEPARTIHPADQAADHEMELE